MSKEEIVWEVKIKGYTYIYDVLGFVNVFASEDKSECVLRTKADCKSKKDFEMECLFISNSGELL